MRSLTAPLLFAAILLVPHLSEAEVLRVTMDRVSLRSEPSTSGSVVATVTRGTLLDVVQKEGYWNRVRVQATGDIGYIHSAFVQANAAQSDRPNVVRNPSPSPSETPPAPERTSSQRAQPRQSEPGYSDIGSFGLGGYVWSGASNVALSPVVDFSEHASFLGTFETVNALGTRIIGLTGNLVYRFSVRGSSMPVTFEPYLGGGAAYFLMDPWSAKGFTILGGTFVRFEALPHFKFSGGLIHAETWGSDFGFGEFSIGGNTLMVGGHYFF
jgi:uncharacterized protein YraI